MFLEFKVIKQQRGAALILALLIVSVVVILASALSSDFLLALRRVENQLHSQQAHAYLRGAEVMARQVLQMDFKNANNKIDHISEGWLEIEQNMLLDQGQMSGRLSDLQGRFNLNDLPGTVTGGKYTPSQLQFIRLLKELNLERPLDQLEAEELTRAVIDWIDTNENTDLRGGAETPYYSSGEDLKVPMRAGNQALNSISELMWIKGMSKEIYLALSPLISVLPEGSKINVNTASAEVLQAMIDNGSGTEGEQLVRDRDGDETNPSQGYGTTEDFINQFTAITGMKKADVPDNIRVDSEYFLLSAQTLFMDRIFLSQSVLHRDADGKAQVIIRSYTGI
ncbi:MAG: type II secretion system minor pseudopilin GspK [Spongiibacteraceae bacterium]|nr:type II secretion system minor pseudopilin GspK [Spongiibacteraceae bacterium]